MGFHIIVSTLGIKGLFENLAQYIKALYQGFLTGGNLAPQCMETFFGCHNGGGYYQHLVGRGKKLKAAKHPTVHRKALPNT